MLELKNITKDYPVGSGTVHALRGISVCFRENEFVSILGQSGCGKTTLLNIIGGLDRYTKGDLLIDGISTEKYRDRDWDAYRNHSVGFVFQSYNLIPHQTVLSNVELALTLSGVSKKERRSRAREVLTRVGLEDQMNKRPNQLSGGQMQRVAIARALVNNPRILLADEPTGALDSETSLQIMELLREVARDRLVIMVTHNPELAEKYSTRIIRLVDGKITDDSRPCQPETPKKSATPKKIRKPSMSFFTAMGLSFNNLMTKKARTVLVSFAGSIGIIGIALILALSTGVQALIGRMQTETLSSYPIQIERKSMDMTAMMTMNREQVEHDIPRDSEHIYSINMMTHMFDSMLSGSRSNNLEEFKKYLDSGKSGMEDLTTEIRYVYDTPLNLYRVTPEGKAIQVNPNHIYTNMGMMQESDATDSLTQLSPFSMDVWKQLLDNDELLETQYDVIAGRMPQKYNEVILIVDEENQLTDFTLYSLGLLDPDKLQDAVVSAADGKEIDLQTGVTAYDFDDILGQKFKLLASTDVFVKEGDLWTDQSGDPLYMQTLLENCEEIEVVGIMKPAENAAASIVSGVLGYRGDLMSHLIQQVNTSQIVLEQQAHPETDVFTGLPFGSRKADYTMEELTACISALPREKQDEVQGYVAQMQAGGMEDDDIAARLMPSLIGSPASTLEENLARMGVSDPDSPSAILLYPKDFESKDEISALIETYNQGLEEEERLAYTDYIGLMISSITTIINAVSYVLIAFVAVSLVVSSIMIGIITYISVLERTREIGILRSIGASKRDISRVFNAETLAIGLGAGFFGIVITLLLILPINALIEHLSGIRGVAALPPVAGVILVAVSMVLTLIAGLIPSRIASKRDPVIALRSE